MNEDDHVGILLDGPRLAQVGELRTLVNSCLGGP